MAAAEMKAADGRESALFDRLIEQHPGEFFIIVELPNVVAGSAPQRIDPLAQKRIPGNRLFRVRQGFSEVAAFRSSDIRQMTVGADTGDRHVRAVLFVRLEERDGHSLLPRDLLRWRIQPGAEFFAPQRWIPSARAASTASRGLPVPGASIWMVKTFKCEGGG